MTTLYHIFGSVHKSFSHYQSRSSTIKWFFNGLQYKHEYNNQYNCVSGWRLCKSSYLRRVLNKMVLSITRAECNTKNAVIAIFLFESLSITTVWSVYIFEIVSSNLYHLVLSRYITISDFWPDCELTTTINYSNPNRKYNFKTSTMPTFVTLCLCNDSGNARNRFQRSDCTSMLLSAQCLLFPSATI
jgi:hypothetical protein